MGAIASIVVACSSGQSGSSTTTQGVSTSVSAPSTTSSSPPPTSTSLVVTTTTIEPTTTTSMLTTTTAPEDLEGDWADQPLIVAAFGALGWWDGAAWVQVDDDTDLPVVGGEDYQVARLGLEAVTSGGPSTLVCDPIENPGVELEHPALLGEWPGPYGVAISAPWSLTPHLVEEIEDDGSYAGFARELLQSRGLDVAEPIIKQLLRVDIEGDGVNEIIVVAEDIQGSYLPPTVGAYSIVFMRKVVDGQVETAVLGDSIVADAEADLVVGYGVGAVADLTGDGIMEVVLSTAYYEGLGVEVWEYFNDDLGMIPTVRTGCGT